jgi:hypothetical protein
MGLKKLCLTAGLAIVAALSFAPGAFAWTFSASGSVMCDTATGEHVITWTIDNRTEPEALTIRASNRASVPVGSTVAARAVRHYTERLAGSTTGTVNLTVKGNWPSDTNQRTRYAYVTLSAGCVADVCPNLGGVQQQVPTGLVKDAAGNCVPPPSDVCPNIEGIQTQVPSGMVKNAAGNCVPPPPPDDVCPNIEGIQTQVPSGMIKSGAGDCVPPPPPQDTCPNIEGIQTQVPTGMVKNGAGNCVPPPPPDDVCPNIEGIQTQVPTGMVKNGAGNCLPPPPPDDVCPNFEGLQTSLPVDFVLDANGQCAFLQRIVTTTVEKMVEVPGPERVVTLSAAPVTVEKVVTKVVIKRGKVAPKKKVKRAKRKLKRRVLPFTPHALAERK